MGGLLAVGIGGALGAMARFGLTLWLPRHAGELPYATLLSNLAGCLLMGGLLQWLAEGDWFAGTRLDAETYRLLLGVGFCGSFTTLSALVFELGALLQRNDVLVAGAYLMATLLGGAVMFYLGVAAVRLLYAP